MENLVSKEQHSHANPILKLPNFYAPKACS